MTNEMIADPRNKRDPERGAALVFAMGVMILVGLISAGVLGFVATGVGNRRTLDDVRNRQYAADFAIESDIARVRTLGVNVGVSSCGAGGPYTANSFSVRVECTNRSVIAFNAGVFFQQRNVGFVACLSSFNPCAGHEIINAQVNYDLNAAGNAIERTYVQSWSVSR